MKARCYSLNFKSYARYGGRGVRVCKEWLDAATFMVWAEANGFKPGLTIDRIDNDGNYEPGNCQFITRSENTKKMWRERKTGVALTS